MALKITYKDGSTKFFANLGEFRDFETEQATWSPAKRKAHDRRIAKFESVEADGSPYKGKTVTIGLG